MENQKSALGLDGNITVLIGYLIPLVALILIFIEKDNKFVRFHAIQAVLWVVAMLVLVIVLAVVSVILGIVLSFVSSTLATLVTGLFFLVYLLWFLAYIGGLIFGAIKGYGGADFKFPIVGGMAEKWSN
jgi:uncharacterized membrane protein